MLTDDDLTGELRSAFRSATGDLTYNGRTRPPRAMTVVLPTVATTATLVAVVVAIGIDAADSHHPGAGRVAVDPAVTSSPHQRPVLVTKTIKLAGFRLTYRAAAGDPPPVFVVLNIDGLPDGVHQIQMSGTEAHAWAGKDPSNGNNAVYVKAPTRNEGNLFALESSVWTQEQLIDLLTTPTQVPAASASHGNAGR